MAEITVGADLMVTTAVVVILATTIILLVMMFKAVFSRASTAPSPDNSSGASPVPNTSSVVIASSSSSSSGSSWKYDVFLSFRGEDTRKTFVDHIYYAFQNHNIHTYKDDVTLDRGDTIGPSLLKAIRESHIALIIFSENYADSSWCLDELAYIMKCKDERGQIVIPIFYDVDPSNVRKQRGQFGKGFSKHKSVNKDRVESWRKALVDASNIAGWEPKFVDNGHEAKCIKEIVSAVLDKLSSLDLVVDDENLVGMGTRLQDLKSQLEIGLSGVCMVGIWGVAGGGKTTLATSLFMEISASFDGCCFVENVREESSQHGLKSLQEKILLAVFNKKIEMQSVDIGKHKIKSMLCHRNVLIVLDDVDDLEQLEALAGSPNWFGDGSRIIITTKDKHLLTAHRVDKVYPVSLLSDDEAIRLFKRHAYCENNPVEDYDNLSLRVIYYVKGLPLAIKILGSFLYGKDKNEWISALDKLREIPNRKVTDQLKISYDGLDSNEKELFLDIACFFRGVMKDNAMEILDACGFHPCIGVTVLIQKSLIAISSDGKFDMHDLVQEMGHHIVRGEHPNNPEKHSRVWKYREISEICSGNATILKENDMIEAIKYYVLDPLSSSFITLLSNLKKLRFLDVTFSRDNRCDGPTFLSNELKYIIWEGYPASVFPESFQPKKLVVLKLHETLQKELWKGKKSMPCLKELELTFSNSLVRIPDIGGLSSLQKLIITRCKSLKEIHQSLGNHASLVYVSVSLCKKLKRFPSIVGMESLEILKISYCEALLEFPKIEANMDSLVSLHLDNVGIAVLPSSVGRYCTNLISLKLEGCSRLKTIEGNFHALKHLQKFKLDSYNRLFENLPKDLFAEKCSLEELCFNLRKSNTLPPGPSHLPRLLRKLNLSGLKDGELPSEIGELYNLQELNLCGNDFSRLDFSLLKLTRLKLLNLSSCDNLVELPELPSSIAILEADYCGSLEAISDDVHRHCNWLSQVSISKLYGEGCGSLVGGERLLESMLQGMAIGNHECMRLLLKGIEIPKGFERRLVRGNKCRLKLPKNWFSEYTGFLFCCVYEDEESYFIDEVKITMRNGSDSEDEQQQQQVFWEEKEEERVTWVGYVSFGSLTRTAWLDQTSTDVHFSIDFQDLFYQSRNAESPISGFGVRLVSKKNQMKEATTTSTDFPSEFSDDDYKCKFKIHHDSKSKLECRFEKICHEIT